MLFFCFYEVLFYPDFFESMNCFFKMLVGVVIILVLLHNHAFRACDNMIWGSFICCELFSQLTIEPDEALTLFHLQENITYFKVGPELKFLVRGKTLFHFLCYGSLKTIQSILKWFAYAPVTPTLHYFLSISVHRVWEDLCSRIFKK